jgi:mono/diheme cytochrome c family protein
MAMTATEAARWCLIGLAIVATACRSGSGNSAVTRAAAVERFGTGRAATPEEIAAWDTDVNGHGAGLPAGRGTASEARDLYASRCAACHGPKGEGGAAGPQLVQPAVAPERPRRSVASHWPYAPPLFDYIRRTMPPHAPWTLTDDQTYALVALLLVDNGIVPEGYAADAASLPRVRMPSRDRFIADDRKGGAEIK